MEQFRQRVRQLAIEHEISRPEIMAGRLGRRSAKGSPSWVLQWVNGWLGPRPKPTRATPLAVPTPKISECSLTFVGHASVLASYASGRLLFDPCFAESLHLLRRAAPAQMPSIDRVLAILISHAHADHFHPPSLRALAATHRTASLVVPRGLRGANELGFARVIEIGAGESVSLGELRVSAIAVQHRVGLFGRGAALGYVVEGTGPTIFFVGDTGYFPGFLEVGARVRPEVAILPISGYRPDGLRRDHLSPLDALYAFEDLGADVLLPIHHSAFALAYEPVTEPLEWLRLLAAARGLSNRVLWLRPGQSSVTQRR